MRDEPSTESVWRKPTAVRILAYLNVFRISQYVATTFGIAEADCDYYGS